MKRMLLAIEPGRDPDGLYHAAVIDLSDDAVLFCSDSYTRIEHATRAATEWIERVERMELSPT